MSSPSSNYTPPGAHIRHKALPIGLSTQFAGIECYFKTRGLLTVSASTPSSELNKQYSNFQESQVKSFETHFTSAVPALLKRLKIILSLIAVFDPASPRPVTIKKIEFEQNKSLNRGATKSRSDCIITIMVKLSKKTMHTFPVIERKDLVETIDRFYNEDWKESAFAFTTEIFLKTERKDLVETIDRFYNEDWKESAFAFTTEIFLKTDCARVTKVTRIAKPQLWYAGEVPVVSRSSFRTTEISNKYSYDIALQYTALDSDFAIALTQLRASYRTIFQTILNRITSIPAKTKVFVFIAISHHFLIPLVSPKHVFAGIECSFLRCGNGFGPHCAGRQYHGVPLQNMIKTLYCSQREEVNPAASLQRIFPVLVGLTPESLEDLCPEFNLISQFSAISGIAEVIRLVSMTVRNRLKITVSQNYHPAVVLKCTSRAQSGKNQSFEVGLAERDSFTVSRSENSILFRGDKGIKGLRDSQQNGHCVISSNPECPGAILTSMGHPLTIIAVTSPIILPTGTTTLLIGREWISIAAKRNASQCQAKVKLTFVVIRGMSQSCRLAYNSSSYDLIRSHFYEPQLHEPQFVRCKFHEGADLLLGVVRDGWTETFS
eukprot:sb/3463176/